MITPAYPGFEVEVEVLNADPTPIVNLTVPAVSAIQPARPPRLAENLGISEYPETKTNRL